MYSATRKKRKHFDAVMKHERVFERSQSLPFEVIVVDSFDGVCLRQAYTDIKIDEQLGKLDSIDAVDLNYIK
jgi:archaellum biogenesis ATPase FlaH